MTRTLRRLDDGTRYYHLTWRQWLAAASAGGVMYVAVRYSPLSARWTFTATLLVVAAVAVVVLPLTGNALSLDRFLVAIVRWLLGARHYYALQADESLRGGVLLSTPPPPAGLHDPLDDDSDDWWAPDRPVGESL